METRNYISQSLAKFKFVKDVNIDKKTDDFIQLNIFVFYVPYFKEDQYQDLVDELDKISLFLNKKIDYILEVRGFRTFLSFIRTKIMEIYYEHR